MKVTQHKKAFNNKSFLLKLIYLWCCFGSSQGERAKKREEITDVGKRNMKIIYFRLQIIVVFPAPSTRPVLRPGT